jgi:hypothetical protein
MIQEPSRTKVDKSENKRRGSGKIKVERLDPTEQGKERNHDQSTTSPSRKSPRKDYRTDGESGSSRHNSGEHEVLIRTSGSRKHSPRKPTVVIMNEIDIRSSGEQETNTKEKVNLTLNSSFPNHPPPMSPRHQKPITDFYSVSTKIIGQYVFHFFSTFCNM